MVLRDVEAPEYSLHRLLAYALAWMPTGPRLDVGQTGRNVRSRGKYIYS